ncbi:MAG: hypothetical protein IPL46_24000 [Saprospiraceae bacterium]|nr:hypothetical protein [Saprospiraceae bacterium]
MQRRCHMMILLISMLVTSALSQRSDLYLVDLLEVAGKFEVHHPRYLSDFNLNGYNNQPYFVDPYTLLTTVAPKAEPLNTDIYQLDLRSKKVTRLTHTADREYSPSLCRDPRNHFNCVIVEVENQDNQILWQYPLDRSGSGQPLLRDVKDVAYFCELPNDRIAVYEVGTPNKLWLVHKDTGEKKFIASNIGRSLQILRSGHLAYVHKFSDDYWFLKKIDPNNFTIEIIKRHYRIRKISRSSLMIRF